MTTKTDTEQERADFEAWWESTPILKENKRTIAEKAYQAGRAALQSQDREDAENYRWLLSKLEKAWDDDGDFESHDISFNCSLQSQRKGVKNMYSVIEWNTENEHTIGLKEAIDHARRIEGDGVANTSHGARCLSETE